MKKAPFAIFVFSLFSIFLLAVLLGLFLREENEREIAALEQIEREEEILSLEKEEEFLAEEETVIEDVSLFFTGDVLFTDSVKEQYDSFGLDGILSEDLQQEMTQAGITIINEEFPFSTRGTKAPNKQFTFRIEPEYVDIFCQMGVDGVSLANNHALDYGTEALSDTFMVLEDAGIPYMGAGESLERAKAPILLERGGRKIGFLAASRVIPVIEWNIQNQQPGLFCTYDSTLLKEAIRETREQCDFLVVYVHWGIEKQNVPEEYQRTLGQEYIDAGADMVIGSHPHVPQGMEFYKGKPIVYSLGNFIFNASTEKTYALKVLYKADGEVQILPVPIVAENGKTRTLQGEENADFLEFLERISFGVTIDENGVVIEE